MCVCVYVLTCFFLCNTVYVQFNFLGDGALMCSSSLLFIRMGVGSGGREPWPLWIFIRVTDIVEKSLIELFSVFFVIFRYFFRCSRPSLEEA